ncbi:MAG: C39 family peptidase [Candidatus Andersenbacteria bacterium]
MVFRHLGATLGTLSILLMPPLAADASVRLPVSFHRQEHSLSCEIATLKMALGAHGVDVSESELIAKLPFDPTPKEAGVWGNPNEGFVGIINGTMLGTGYGVYWDPIAKVGNDYAPTHVIKHGSASEVARHIDSGNPVIVWGYYGRRAVHSWRTPAGESIKAVNGEHTRIVYGFDGTADNPTHFYLIDPIDGHMSWSTEEFMHNWSALNHHAVVVLPPRTWIRVIGDIKVWEVDISTNTRQWVTTWDIFEARGGTSQAIQSVTSEELLRYTVGTDIL